LTSALTGVEWSASHPYCFTHWIGGWAGPRAGLDDVEKRKFLTLPGLELRPIDCAIPAAIRERYYIIFKEVRVRNGLN
jgi:hypothetical protein